MGTSTTMGSNKRQATNDLRDNENFHKNGHKNLDTTINNFINVIRCRSPLLHLHTHAHTIAE